MDELTVPSRAMSDLDQLHQFIVDLKADRDAAKAKEKAEAWTRGAGVSVVFVAVLAAVATQWGAKYSGRTMTALNDATYAQTLASDQWSFYQAKSIKQNFYEVARDQEEANPSERTPKIVADFTSNAIRFSEEKLAIKSAAEKLDRQRQSDREMAHAWSTKGGAMGLSVSVYQLAIAVASIAILMKRKPFWFASLVLAAGATLQMVHVFLM
jgi:hypothetical protein